MASISITATSTGERRYRVRYRDPGGSTREKWYRRRVDAERFAATTEADKLRGLWIDPQAGRATLGEYMAEWSAGRTHIRESTRSTHDSLMRNHILSRIRHVAHRLDSNIESERLGRVTRVGRALRLDHSSLPRAAGRMSRGRG